MMMLSDLQFVSFAKQLLGRSLSDMHMALRAPLTVLAFVVKNIFLMYPVTMFMLLSWQDCFKVRHLEVVPVPYLLACSYSERLKGFGSKM